MNTNLHQLLTQTFPGDWKITGSCYRMTNGTVTVCVSSVFDDKPGAMCYRYDVSVNEIFKSTLFPDEVPRTIRTLIEDHLSPFATDFRVWFGGHTARSIVSRYRESTAGMIRDMERDIKYHRERLKAYDEILEKLGGEQ